MALSRVELEQLLDKTKTKINTGPHQDLLRELIDTIYGELSGGGGVPALHNTTHENGGADELNLAGMSGLLATRQTPSFHAASHASGATDELAGQNLAVTTAAPSNYTPSANTLTGHLSGIDTALAEVTAVSAQIRVVDPTLGNDTVGTAGTASDPYKSIVFTLTQITDSSSVKPYVVVLGPGVYPENNPIVMLAFVSIISLSGFEAVTVSAQNTASPIFQTANSVRLRGFSIQGATTSIGIEVTHSGELGIVGIRILDCLIGIDVDNSGVFLSISDIIGRTVLSAMTSLIRITGGKVDIDRVVMGSLAQTVTNLIEISGSNSDVSIDRVLSSNTNVTNGINISNLCAVSFSNSIISRTSVGILMEGASILQMSGMQILGSSGYGIRALASANNTSLTFAGSIVTGSTILDISIESDNFIFLGSGITDSSKVSVTALTEVVVTFVDLQETDRGNFTIGNSKIGIATRGSDLSVGGGASYISGVLSFTFDGVSFVNVTDDMKDVNTTVSFPNTSIGTAIYLAASFNSGSIAISHPGFRCLLDTAVILGAGRLAVEYWDGGSWVEMTFMFSEADNSYFPKAQTIFEGTGDHNIRYNNNINSSIWIENDPMSLGMDFRWVRIIIKDAVLTTVPVLSQIRLHPNHKKTNKDGWDEYMGTARSTVSLPWSATGLNQASTNNGNANWVFSDNIDIGLNDNALGVGDRVAFTDVLPEDCDTSTPIKIRIAVRSDFTGDFNYILRWAYAIPLSPMFDSAVGAPTTHATEQSISDTISIVANQITWLEEEIDFSNAVARRDGGFPDAIALSIENDLGSVVTQIGILNGSYTQWCNGGHV